MARYVAPPRVAELARSVAPSNANCGVDVSVDAMYTPPPSTAPLDSMTPPMTLSLAPTCRWRRRTRRGVRLDIARVHGERADAGDVHGATVGGRGVLFDRGSGERVVTGGDEQRAASSGDCRSHPTAALSLNADAVAVICAPRGELVAASAGAGTTKTAPPLGAVLLRTVVVPAMASVVGAAGVFGSSERAAADGVQRATARTAHCSIPIDDGSVRKRRTARLGEIRAAAETRRDVLSNDDAGADDFAAAVFAADARETGTVRGGVCRDFATVQRQRRTCGDVRAATGETRDVTLDSGVGQDERRSAVHAHAGAVFGRDVGHHARVGHAGRALRVHEDATTDLSLVFVERESVEIGVRVRVDDDARAPEQRGLSETSPVSKVGLPPTKTPIAAPYDASLPVAMTLENVP